MCKKQVLKRVPYYLYLTQSLNILEIALTFHFPSGHMLEL